MQQQIFIDQAPAHEAYRTAGIDGIEAMFADGQIDQGMYDAWSTIHQGIETGNQELIEAGNLQLLRREQFDIIRDDYDEMYARPLGPLITYAMTTIGRPSIPGAQGYGEVFPVIVEAPIGPGPSEFCAFGLGCVDNPVQGTVEITTPLPNGNIAHFDDRWDLITQDTLPAYLELLEDPDAAAAIVGSDVGDRIDDQRLDIVEVMGELLEFDFDFEQ